MIDQLPMWPVFVDADGDRYRTLYEAAQAKPRTPRANYQQWTAPRTLPCPTVWDDVWAIADIDEADDLFDRTAGEEVAPLERIAAEAVECLRGWLDEQVGDGFYVMPHSGGYDSRLIAALLSELIAWVKPVTWAPETKVAQQLCDRYGWTVCAYPGGVDHYAPVLLAMEWLGRHSSDPQWQGGRHYLLHYLSQVGICGSVDAIITGVWSDETLAWSRHRLGTVRHFVQHRLLAQHAAHPHVIAPFASRAWLEGVVCRYRLTEAEPGFSAQDTLKRAMLRVVNPELLEVPNPRFTLSKLPKPLPHRRLSEATQRELERRAPDLGPAPDQVRANCPWLCEWTRRAIVEVSR